MSNGLGDGEIEDVVSSVRRLVSPAFDRRPISRDLGKDKLLLTPALRVGAEPAAPTLPPLVLSVLAIEPAPVAAEPIAAAPLDPVTEGLAGGQPTDGEWEDALWTAPEHGLAELALGTEEAEVLEAAPAEPAAAKAITVDPAPVETAPEIIPEAPFTAVEDDEPYLDPSLDPPEAIVLGAADPSIRPEQRFTQPAEVLPFPQPGSDMGRGRGGGSDGGAQLLDVEGNSVTVLDEDDLAEMVRSLIRLELQGDLGERITQNVRKLVRAEINRALAARSLD
jgi:hypothetical protein